MFFTHSFACDASFSIFVTNSSGILFFFSGSTAYKRGIPSLKSSHFSFLHQCSNNFFLLLASLGISDKLFGSRLLPVGTIYDTFIGRGLDALNYATYMNARFILIGTPSGITLSHEGGAHQSILTPNKFKGFITLEKSLRDKLLSPFKITLCCVRANIPKINLANVPEF